MSIGKDGMVSTDAQQVLLSKYETAYQIFNHDSDTDPFSYKLVELHPAETVYDQNSVYVDKMRIFYRLKIFESFGLNWLEFIELPRHVQDMMIDTLESFKIKEREEEQQRQQAMENSMRRDGYF